VLITGGAGFIGTNVAHCYLSAGQPVRIFDNLSRPGVGRNLAWLTERHGALVELEEADIQNYQRLTKAVRGVSKVFHFAAQVAVTTSLEEPFHDFEVNARGTLNLLEALRALSNPPPLIFTSTNKVYGALEDVVLRAGETRYEPLEGPIRRHGFDEVRPLDFHSPYGCSKGAAEQYVLDYARTFRLPAAVFRMSCIYGPHQFGTEDQGWVAHFLIRALEGRSITVYGDGKQVRDILFVDDLIEALKVAHEKMPFIAGQAFNIGGGAGHTLSLLELIDLIAELEGEQPLVHFDQWRPADQQYYVSDIRKFSRATGWTPRISVREGITHLVDWLRASGRPAASPIVVAAPELVATNNGQYPSQPSAKMAAKSPGLQAAARSKRLWKIHASEPDETDNKIIKFP
jgi:CDP-paratose 2-epimerase